MSVKTGVVPRFDGEYFFLSNFYESEFEWRGRTFTTGEHAFQAAKVWCWKDGLKIDRLEEEFEKIRTAPTPAKAKYFGRSVKLDVEEWDNRKVGYMREIVHARFANIRGLAGQLINTGAMLLVEGNDWGDDFWGRCLKDGKMVGLNTLGTILMEERGYWLYSDFKDKNDIS